MSISANAIWQKTGGSDSAGGGFDPSLTANMFADLTCTLGTGNSPVVASASYNFVSHDVGDWLFIEAGTNWLFGWFKIVSVNAGAATLSAAVGTAQSYAAGSGQFYLNTVAGVASVATQSANKATWAIDRSRRSGGAIFTSGTVGTSATSAFTPSTNTLTYTPGQQDVGNILQLISGTGSGFTASMYAITNATSTIYTLDRSTGATTATAISWSLGGSFATIGGMGGLINPVITSDSQRIYLSGSETITSASTNVSGGTCGLTVFGTGAWVEGFKSVCGDLLPGAYITVSGITNVTLLAVGNSAAATLTNVTIDAAGLSQIQGSSVAVVFNTNFCNFSAGFTYAVGGCSSLVGCYFYNCGISIRDPISISRCVGDTSGFQFNTFGNLAAGTITHSVTTNAGGIAHGRQTVVLNCVSYNSTADGIGAPSYNGTNVNTVSYLSGGYGFNTIASEILINCAGGANSSGPVNVGSLPGMDQGYIALTSDPYTGNHVGGGTDLVVNASNSTWVTTATNTTVGGGGTAQSSQDVGLSIFVYGGSGWVLGLYKIVGYDSGSGSWILNASPAATSTTGGSWRIADFRPNNVAGGGAALRAAGIGPVGQLSYPDIGAVQHQDSGGGGSPVVIAPFGGSSSLLAM